MNIWTLIWCNQWQRHEYYWWFLSFSSSSSQEVFRQAMSSPMVYAEVLPVANKLQYEKSLIGQLFNADDLARTKSPTVVRARIDSQPEAKPDPKVNQLVRRPGQRSRTPDLTVLEVKSETSSLERVSPTPPERAASTSPQPNTHSHSQPPSMSPVSDSMLDPINKKGGKRMKIDLKKGNFSGEESLIVSVFKWKMDKWKAVSNSPVDSVWLHHFRKPACDSDWLTGFK